MARQATSPAEVGGCSSLRRGAIAAHTSDMPGTPVLGKYPCRFESLSCPSNDSVGVRDGWVYDTQHPRKGILISHRRTHVLTPHGGPWEALRE